MNGDRRRPRRLSERQIKWLLTLYPPLLLQRVRCVSVGRGFRSARVRVSKSFVTRNLNGTTFGGTIFSAADPVYALLFWQIFAHEGTVVQVWLKTASIDYVKPAASALTLDFAVGEADVDEVRALLARDGRCRKNFRVTAVDRAGETCAAIETEVYLRRPRAAQREVSGF